MHYKTLSARLSKFLLALALPLHSVLSLALELVSQALWLCNLLRSLSGSLLVALNEKAKRDEVDDEKGSE